MKSNLNRILKDENFVSNNGFYDYLVYKYDNSHPLSGNLLSDSGDIDEDIVIKFDYGYHNYDLGRKYILQSFDTISDYYEMYINTKMKDLDIKKEKYIIRKLDDRNVFLFTTDPYGEGTGGYFREQIQGSDIVGMLKIGKVLILSFGKIEIDEDELLKDYDDILEELELKSAMHKYNL